MRKLFYCLGLLCFIMLPATILKAQNLLDPLNHPKFMNPLPVPSVLDVRSGGSFNIAINQFQQNLGLINPTSKKPMLTTVWGYNGSYPGPTILAKKDVSIDVTWNNQLIKNGTPLPHLLPIDLSIDWALRGKKDWKRAGVPIVTHIHGGHSESASDGLPDAWFTPNFAMKGPGFVKQALHYNNDQEAATIWYHDHAMGITRLNVYAGLAGYYIITDDNEIQLQNSYQIPSGAYDLGLAIQDRMFTALGELYYTNMPASAGVPKSSIMPEFFGDFILVNGKVWPYLEVEPRPYRFRVLNGSDSRFYNLSLSTGQSFVQIGTDGGLLETPVALSNLLMGTGERRDVVIDFSNFTGQIITMTNDANTPYPDGSSVDPQTTGLIMQFKVTKTLSSTPKAILPNTLRPPIIPLATTLPARKLILFEGEDEYSRLKVMLGTFEDGVLGFSEPITENIKQGNTEIWEIYNETVDAHPIHLHQVQMQLVNRQKFTASVDMNSGKPSNVQFQGDPKGPEAGENGWKDTYIMYPGEVTRVIATFDLAGLYVWHCHILSHEDHEMMRPFFVQANAATSIQKAVDATPQVEQQYKLVVRPNPFNNQATIQLNLNHDASLKVSLFDTRGSVAQLVYNGKRSQGVQQFTIDGSNLANGTYFCEVVINNQRLVRKLVLQK